MDQLSESRPRMVIASSAESIEDARALQVALDVWFEVTVWDQGLAEVSDYTMDALVREIGESSFGVIFANAEDERVSRGRVTPAARDNVLVEYGLMVGTLGRQRTFLVHRSDQTPVVPSDLLGIARATYLPRRDGNRVAMMSSVATQIRTAASRAPRRIETAASSDFASRAVQYIADAAAGLARGNAGVSFHHTSSTAIAKWHRAVVETVSGLYSERASDLSTAIFIASTARGGIRQLRLTQSKGIPNPRSYHRFAWNEGMAGRAWATGAPALHTSEAPNQWWVPRPGCENATYFCAPIVLGTESVGLLTVGSDSGFRADQQDLRILEAFANVLAPTFSKGSV